TAPLDIYTLSLHDALPIWLRSSRTGLAMSCCRVNRRHLRLNYIRIARKGKRLEQIPQRRDRESLRLSDRGAGELAGVGVDSRHRSEEHTSELQSRSDLVCR